MNGPMDEFIHRCNVANYARLLLVSHDAPRRKVLIGLLAEEGASAMANGWPTLDRTPMLRALAERCTGPPGE